MTPAEVKAICDQLGGTKAMAEQLEVCDRAVRRLCQKGVKRPKLEREIKGLIQDTAGSALTSNTSSIKEDAPCPKN